MNNNIDTQSSTNEKRPTQYIALPALFSEEVLLNFRQVMRDQHLPVGWFEIEASFVRLYEEQQAVQVQIIKRKFPVPEDCWGLYMDRDLNAYISEKSINMLRGRRIELSYISAAYIIDPIFIAYKMQY